MDSASFSENGIFLNIENTVQTPKKNEIFFNPDMLINRDELDCSNGSFRFKWDLCLLPNTRSLSICALAAYNKTGLCINKPMRCLDAFGATGIAGLSWAKAFSEVEVTVNDPLDSACKMIKQNEMANNLSVEVTQQEINILLLQRPFDFVFLDCYGSSVHYLDAAFRHVPKNGLLVITSTDDASLYGKAPDVTLRNYGGYIVKTFYAKELAARLVIASIVRAAARSNKGIEVLCCIAIKSHITVIVRIIRGPASATQCAHKIRRLIHCCICEDRAFYPRTVYPIEDPYSLLSCKCRAKSSGQVAVELGPVWIGPIFDSNFCGLMLKEAKRLSQPSKVVTLLQTILTESLGGKQLDSQSHQTLPEDSGKPSQISSPSHDFKEQTNICSEDDESETFSSKRRKTDNLPSCPHFYFNLHRHSPKGYDLCKLNKVVNFIQKSGHTACRTHFDPEAVRTSASLKQFNELLIKFAKGTQH